MYKNTQFNNKTWSLDGLIITLTVLCYLDELISAFVHDTLVFQVNIFANDLRFYMIPVYATTQTVSPNESISSPGHTIS